MVYMSGGKSARNQASIVNRPTCGGPKKGGLGPTVGNFYSSRPQIYLRCAPQLSQCPVGNQIPCFPISTTIQTQKYGYRATIGGNMG
jgi:hypothetical protein